MSRLPDPWAAIRSRVTPLAASAPCLRRRNGSAMLGSSNEMASPMWAASRSANQGMGAILPDAHDPFERERRPPVIPIRRSAVGMFTAQPTPSGRSVNSFGDAGFQYARLRSPSFGILKS